MRTRRKNIVIPSLDKLFIMLILAMMESLGMLGLISLFSGVLLFEAPLAVFSGMFIGLTGILFCIILVSNLRR